MSLLPCSGWERFRIFLRCIDFAKLAIIANLSTAFTLWVHSWAHSDSVSLSEVYWLAGITFGFVFVLDALKARRALLWGRADASPERAEAAARLILKPDSMGCIGIPDYSLRNNLANIKRIRRRIAELEAKERVREVLRAEGGGRD